MSQRTPTRSEYLRQIRDALSGPTREEAHALSKQRPYKKEERLMEDVAKDRKSVV